MNALCVFKQIWPDQGDWNLAATVAAAPLISNLNKFDPIKGIETKHNQILVLKLLQVFKQIWPDQGDWNTDPDIALLIISALI